MLRANECFWARRTWLGGRGNNDALDSRGGAAAEVSDVAREGCSSLDVTVAFLDNLIDRSRPVMDDCVPAWICERVIRFNEDAFSKP